MIVKFVPNLIENIPVTFDLDCDSITSAVEMLSEKVNLEGIPHIARVNGIPILRDSWDSKPNGELEIVCVPGLEMVIISTVITIVGIIASWALSKLFAPDYPTIPGSALPKSRDVFSFSGRQNAQKLNEPIEVSYGRNRWYPPFLTLPRIRFDEQNRTYIDLIFSLGVGDIDVSEIKVGDTPIENIPNSSWQIASPGWVPDSLDMFDMVFIGDKTNVDLAGPNEDDFEQATSIINPSNAPIQSIQVNLGFPSGLYGLSGSTLVNATAEAEITFRGVDAYGNPTTAWADPNPTVTVVAKSNNPLRYSYTFEPSFAADRYEVKVFRANNASTATSGQDRMTLISVYGLGRSTSGIPTNILMVSIEGSNMIEEDSASKINCVTQRKLRTLSNDTGTWTSPVATRNPVWAILDLLTANYGAKIPSANLDYEYWFNLSQGVFDNFDTVFSNKTTVWDALKAVAETIRAEPVPVGSDIRLAMDRADLLPVCQFTPDNAANLTWSTAFTQPLDADCVEAVFIDPISGLQSSVQFTPLGSAMLNPKTITFTGIGDRDQAWRMAAYRWQKLSLCKDKVNFTAGMDGMIPLYGDIINVAWPFPAWACAGIVLDYDGSLTLEVSEVLPAVSVGLAWMTLRAKDGSIYGPVRCEGSGSAITLLAAVPGGLFDFEGIVSEPVMFTFGTADTLSKNFRVTSLSPSGNSVEIEAIEHDAAAFIYDSFDAPAFGQDRIPYVAENGGVPWVRVVDELTAFRAIFPPVVGGSYSVAYAYDPTGSFTDAQVALNPGGYSFTLTNAQVFGTVCYIPKSTGRLFIRVRCVVAGTTFDTWWRASVTAPIALRVDNSIPASVANVAHAASGQTGVAVSIPYGADKVVVKCNSLNKQSVTLGSLSGLIDDFGRYVFNESQLAPLRNSDAGTFALTVGGIGIQLTQQAPPNAAGISSSGSAEFGQIYVPRVWTVFNWSKGYIKKYDVYLETTAQGEWGTKWFFDGKNLVSATNNENIVSKGRSTNVVAYDCAVGAPPVVTGTNTGGMSPDAVVSFANQIVTAATISAFPANAYTACFFLDANNIPITPMGMPNGIFLVRPLTDRTFSINKVADVGPGYDGGIYFYGSISISYNELLALQAGAVKLVIPGIPGYYQGVLVGALSKTTMGAISAFPASTTVNT